MTIKSFWADDYTSSDQHINENAYESLHTMHEQLMEMTGIKLLYDTDTKLWGWEVITAALKGQNSSIKFPTRTLTILDAVSKILSSNKYNNAKAG